MKTGAAIATSTRFTHYCALCTSCLEFDAAVCPVCQSPPPNQGWATLDSSPYPFLGKILDDRYVLTQFLGDGATGYVYRAKAMHISRNFAAKIVDTRRYGKPEFEAELLRRYRLEVEAMSQLRNPHVVAIYEAMQLHDHLFVLVMDFVDGRTLQELLDRVGRIKIDRALDIVRQIANGLYEAHTLGFIHRDLKPDNIMIERLPAAGFFARILDFGIVHMRDNASATQGFRGTPLYASPEQCMGDPGIDHRSDIYSLGCVFYHCVAGRPPFPGSESLRVMDAHVYDEPDRVSTLLPESRIPPSVDDLLTRMLAKDPDDRPQDLSEVIDVIDRLIQQVSQLDEPTNPEPPTIAPEMRRAALERRIETADFPTAQLGEPSSSGTTQLVRPLVEFRLPEPIGGAAQSFTASALNNTGEHGVVADRQHRVHVFGLKNDGYFRTFEGAQGTVTAVYFDQARGRVFASQIDGPLLRWNVDAPGEPPTRIALLSDRIYAMTTDRAGRNVLCGTDRGRVVSVSLENGAETVLVESGPPISALQKSPTENKLLVGYWGGNLQVIELSSRRVQDLIPLPDNPISMVISADGYIAAVLDEEHHVRILSLVHGTQFFEIRAGDANLRALAFAEGTQLIGMGLAENCVQLWDIKNEPAMKHLE